MDHAPRLVVEKEFEKYNVDTIMQKVDQSSYSLYSCELACRALATLTALGVQGHDTEILIDCLENGVCEMLVAAIHKHSVVSSVVASYACQTIAIMAYGSIELKEFLGEVGACEAVVFATLMNVGDADTSEYGSCAIGLLAQGNISNSYRLAESGACECIAQTGNFGFNLRHERSHVVATNVCIAASHLCEASNARQLLDSGIGDLLSHLVRLHTANSSVIFAGIKAICGLASLNFEHREHLGRIGVCELLVETMKKYQKVDFVQDCCEAMLHLSLSPNNSQRLGHCGAIPAIVQALREKLILNNFGAEICTGALLNLCTYGTSCKDHRNQLSALQSIELLKSTQMSPKASYRARENVVQLLDILGASNSVSGSASRSKQHKNEGTLVGVFHGSEVKGNTRPLAVEIREYEEFRTMTTNSNSSAEDEFGVSFHSPSEQSHHNSHNSHNIHNYNHNNHNHHNHNHQTLHSYRDDHNNNNNSSSNNSNNNSNHHSPHQSMENMRDEEDLDLNIDELEEDMLEAAASLKLAGPPGSYAINKNANSAGVYEI